MTIFRGGQRRQPPPEKLKTTGADGWRRGHRTSLSSLSLQNISRQQHMHRTSSLSSSRTSPHPHLLPHLLRLARVARSGGGPKQRPRGGAVVPGGAEQPRLDVGPRHLAVARRRTEEALLQSPGGGAMPRDGNGSGMVRVEQIPTRDNTRNSKAYLYPRNLAGKILYPYPYPPGTDRVSGYPLGILIIE
jgi:hypothetical protein